MAGQIAGRGRNNPINTIPILSKTIILGTPSESTMAPPTDVPVSKKPLRIVPVRVSVYRPYPGLYGP